MTVLNLLHLREPMLILKGKLTPPASPGAEVEVLISETTIDAFDAASRPALEVFTAPILWSDAVAAVQALGGSSNDVVELVSGNAVLVVEPGDLASLAAQLHDWRVVVTGRTDGTSPDGTVTVDAGDGYGVTIALTSAGVIARATQRISLEPAVAQVAEQSGVSVEDIWQHLFIDIPALLGAGAAFVTTA